MAIKVFRFALGTPQVPLSGRWRLWTHEDEVHLGVTAREPVELTAYPTGRWRIAIGPVVSRWTRPKEFRPGWTRGPDLIIPHCDSAVRLSADDKSKEPVTWLAPPAPRTLARFSLLFASPRSEVRPWRPAERERVTVLPLRTAGSLYLCRLDEPMIPDEMADAGSANSGFTVIVRTDQAGHPSLMESRLGSEK